MAYEELRQRSRLVWDSGEYAPTSRQLEPAAEALVEALGAGPGDVLLDVAAGDGSCAIAAARRGADVVATDFSPVQVDRGRARTAAARLDVRWQEADAAALPFGDGAFDLVASSFGAIFAPEQERVARELVRVLRPAGRLGMTAWVHDGLVARLQRLSRSVLPPAEPGHEEAPDPYRWGDQRFVRKVFEPMAAQVAIQTRTVTFRHPSWEAWRADADAHGMAVVLRRMLTPQRYADLLAAQQQILAEAARTDTEEVAYDLSYLQILVTVP